jgi:hypothetical protein
MSIEINDFDPIQEKLIRKREPKLNKLLNDKNICAIEKDISGRFIIKYNTGQIFKCSGSLPNRCIKMTFCKEIIKKRKLF